MARVVVRTPEQTDSTAAPEGGWGAAQARIYFDDESDPLHLCAYDIAGGAGVHLGADGADLAFFVWKGSVTADGVRLDERSSGVVEPGASLDLAGGVGGATVLVFSQRQGDARATSTGKVLLLPAERVPRTHAMGGNAGVGGALHADAHDPIARVWLHENEFAEAEKETVLHSHSEDEVIFVCKGGIRLGNRLYPEGTALFIAADTKYGFHSGPEGLGYVNFRTSSPTYTSADGAVVLDEAKLWRDAVGKPEHLMLG